MTRTLLIRGMLVGLLAGVLAFLIARALGEGPLSSGIAFEAAREPAGAATTPELVTRTVQSTAGLATGTLAFAIALGGIFGLAYAVTQGRLGSLSARGTAAVVAAGGFLALYLLPALKYPANPPGTSDSDTIADRTQWY
ncbi:MAG: CbtA family protein, partial [Mycobacteriaceae bacterium]